MRWISRLFAILTKIVYGALALITGLVLAFAAAGAARQAAWLGRS